MRPKQDARRAVEELRRHGLSYREILQRVPVSKSSVSLWCRPVVLNAAQAEALQQRKRKAGQQGLAKITQLRELGQLERSRPDTRRRTLSMERQDNHEEVARIRALYNEERLSFREVAIRMGVSQWRVYKLMQKHHIPRRRGSEQNYATYKTKPQFHLKNDLRPEEEQLRIAGTMLYLAEGAKRGTGVDFTNSDPRLIEVFLTFLRNVCGVAEERLRVHLYAYADQDIAPLMTFWSRLTHIPVQQFIKPYVRDLTPNLSGRKMPSGLVHITYSDMRLLQLIQQWGKEICQSWAGAGVANRSSL